MTKLDPQQRSYVLKKLDDAEKEKLSGFRYYSSGKHDTPEIVEARKQVKKLESMISKHESMISKHEEKVDLQLSSTRKKIAKDANKVRDKIMLGGEGVDLLEQLESFSGKDY